MDLVRLGKVFVAVLFVGFVVFWIYQTLVDEPRAALALQRLQSEMAQVQAFPGLRLDGERALHKTTTALVSHYYVGQASYPDLRRYYDAELSKYGWQFCAEDRFTYRGEDLGGLSAHYRKEDLRATIDYAGAPAIFGWTYALGMSWGLSDPCK